MEMINGCFMHFYDEFVYLKEKDMVLPVSHIYSVPMQIYPHI